MTGSYPTLLPWLQLSLIPELTGAAWRRLSARFGAPKEILARPAETLAAIVGAEVAQRIAAGPDPTKVEQALQWAGSAGREILTPEDGRYPSLLLQSAAAPPLLYAEGRIELLQRASLAIVGSRNATAQGLRNAQTFSRATAASNVAVVGGLALGIDAAAHAAAVAEMGSTIAVLGNGADVIYPRRNAALFDRLRCEGLILTEFPLGTAPVGTNFPRRNRIIAGISKGCLVVEAAMASGSLITARLAVEMGRDVFAIPGSIHSALSRGCHYLIKQGAKLVETPEEVLEEFGVTAAPMRVRSNTVSLSIEHARILECLGYEPCDLDSLIERSGSPAEEVLASLLQCELEGYVARLADGTYQRVK